MATRSNPYYQYQNPALGQAFQGIAQAMFPGVDKTQAEILAKQAQAGASQAQAAASYSLAAERDQNTRGKSVKNDRYEAAPTDLASLFLSGGRLQDEPMRSNPLFQAPAPIDYSAVMRGEPVFQDSEPAFLGGRTAVDQLAAALQQMEAYGFKPQEVMKAIGGMQYLNLAAGADPQAALPFAPFAGVTSPNAGTALSSSAQNRISARDAQEALTQATTVEGMRNQNRIEIEGMREDGRNTRGTGTGRTGTGSTASIPAVTPSTAKAMRESLTNRLNQLGYSTIEPQAIDSMVSLASRLFQDKSSPAFKNSAQAVQEAVDMLEMGQVPDLTETTKRNFFGSEKRTLSRVPAAERGADPAPAAPAAAKPAKQPDLAKIPGVPSGSKIGKQTGQGWEVFDKSGKIIGYIQE